MPATIVTILVATGSASATSLAPESSPFTEFASDFLLGVPLIDLVHILPDAVGYCAGVFMLFGRDLLQYLYGQSP